jgi:hypothetical protein
VRCIGQGSRLEVSPHGVGFIARRERSAGPSARNLAVAGPRQPRRKGAAP